MAVCCSEVCSLQHLLASVSLSLSRSPSLSLLLSLSRCLSLSCSPFLSLSPVSINTCLPQHSTVFTTNWLHEHEALSVSVFAPNELYMASCSSANEACAQPLTLHPSPSPTPWPFIIHPCFLVQNSNSAGHTATCTPHEPTIHLHLARLHLRHGDITQQPTDLNVITQSLMLRERQTEREKEREIGRERK